MFSRVAFFASIFLAEITIISAAGSDIVPRESVTSVILCSEECRRCQLDNGKEVICNFSKLKLFETFNAGSIAVLRAEFSKEKDKYAIQSVSTINCVDRNQVRKQCSLLKPIELEVKDDILSCMVPKKPSPNPWPRDTGHAPISPPHYLKKPFWKKYKTMRELSLSADLEENLQSPYDELSVRQGNTIRPACRAAVAELYDIKRRRN